MGRPEGIFDPQERYFDWCDSTDLRELKRTFNELARKFHPDKKGGCSEAFRHVYEQYKEAQVRCDTSAKGEASRPEGPAAVNRKTTYPSYKDLDTLLAWLKEEMKENKVYIKTANELSIREETRYIDSEAQRKMTKDEREILTTDWDRTGNLNELLKSRSAKGDYRALSLSLSLSLSL
jgi:hypothetical protein